MPYLLILFPLLGLAPAFIARNKGRSFILWWAYGTALSIIALPHAILLHGTYANPYSREMREPASPWPVILWTFASLIVAAVTVIAYRTYAPTGTERDSTRQTAEAHPPGVLSKTSSAGEATLPPEKPQTAVAATEAPAASVDLRQSIPAERMAKPDSAVSADRRHVSVPLPRARDTLGQGIFSPVPVTPLPLSSIAKPGTAAASEKPASSEKSTPAQLALIPPQNPKKATNPAKTPAPETEVNAIGEVVFIVQRKLTDRGYKPGTINGRAHKQTQRAIRKFQIDRGLTPTGTIDHTLLMNLDIVGAMLTPFQTPRVTAPAQ